MSFNAETTSRYTKEEKKAFLKMTLEEKIQRTKELILEWYLQFDGKVYVSFSGGKDSTVLLHIARSITRCKDIVGVFSDTGLEYPEIRDFVKKQDNITWIRPKLTFKEVIEKYGFPIISKDQSRAIYDIRTTKSEKHKKYRLEGRYDGGGYCIELAFSLKNGGPLFNQILRYRIFAVQR